MPPLSLLSFFLLVSVCDAQSASSLPMGPRTLGTLQGFGSVTCYTQPATRTDGFGQWLGWRPQWANTCLDFSQWSLFPSFFIDPFNKNATEATITLQTPSMFQSSTTNTTWAEAMNGTYNSKWYQTANQICNVQGKCDVYIRFGWEMNGNWYPWAAALNLTAYLAYYKHTVDAMRSVPNNNFKFIWNPGALYLYGANSLNPPWDAYPGDDYVDAIALDIYDADWATYAIATWQVNKTQAQINAIWTSQWAKYKNGLYGLDEFLAYAIAHNKQLAIAEWGLKPTNAHGGGDNTIFIQNMYDWMTNATTYPHLLYQAYYDNEDSTISTSPINPSNVAFPNSTALFKKLFGPSNPFWVSSSSTPLPTATAASVTLASTSTSTVAATSTADSTSTVAATLAATGTTDSPTPASSSSAGSSKKASDKKLSTGAIAGIAVGATVVVAVIVGVLVYLFVFHSGQSQPSYEVTI